MVEHIHLNPVRASLVKRVEEWPWSSVHDYSGNLGAPVSPNRILAIDRIISPAQQPTPFEGKPAESLGNETPCHPLTESSTRPGADF